MFRSNDYLDDLMDVDPSVPATNPIFLGTAFRQQNDIGPTFTDPNDDRVAYIGDAYDPTVMFHRSLSLPADLASTGDSVHGGVVFQTGFEQATNPNQIGSFGPDGSDKVGAFRASENGGQWYDTLRPHAGIYLPVMDDDVYASLTGDVVAERVYGAKDPLFVEPGVREVPEKPLQYASRLSTKPSNPQGADVDFGAQLGAWEWSGSKRAMERPIADSGPWFDTTLSGTIPSPSGAGGSMESEAAYNLYPQPMTFRAPPTPWDTGTNADNGFYVDSGV